MVAYSFKKRFAPPILAGLVPGPLVAGMKRQTVRADRIAALFDPSIFCATVSVVCERSEGMPASNQHQRDLAASFAARLVGRGFDVRVFDPAAQDSIGGGCGQLWFVQQWMRDNPSLAKPTVGNGLPVVHAPAA